jgi:hypothetical protein
MTKVKLKVFPVANPDTPDVKFSKQKVWGICDWKAEDNKKRVAFGHTKQAAIDNYEKLFGKNYTLKGE